MAAPYATELAAYGLEDLVPQGRVRLRPRAVNWKNVADNYSDGMHIAVAHPGLARLFGDDYRIEAHPWIDRMSGAIRDVPSSSWTERLYQRLLPAIARDGAAPPAWTYYKLWPNVALETTRTRSTSCSSSPSPRPRRCCARSPTRARTTAGRRACFATSTGASIVG